MLEKVEALLTFGTSRLVADLADCQPRKWYDQISEQVLDAIKVIDIQRHDEPTTSLVQSVRDKGPRFKA